MMYEPTGTEHLHHLSDVRDRGLGPMWIYSLDGEGNPYVT